MKIAEKVQAALSNISFDTAFMMKPPQHPGIWVRGDGSRYRESPYLLTDKQTDSIWDALIKLKPSRILEVSGEMGSDPFKPAMILAGVLYVKGWSVIEFGSPNRLKNADVWRSREPQVI